MLIDTHTHLYLDEFSPTPEAAVERAIAADVKKLIFPNVDLGTIGPMNRLRDSFPGHIFMAMGLHPTEINENWESDLAEIEAELTADPAKYIAIGEIGIDLYWDQTFRKQQQAAFSRQVDWAIERNVPVIIHCREGLDDVLAVLSDKGGKTRGVFHSFGGSVEDVRRIRQIGDFYFGINGIVTFKNSRLSDTLSEIGIKRILLETDSPYLAPVPYRGKRNESAYIPNIATKIAESLGLTFEEVAQQTTVNAVNLFAI